ncbi:hypothetical protein PHMEG_00030705 [Phytophthora megakarya]|uniref:Transposase n=1 Tax=Phytophthora megakarya TaxID=4795 RepID=A0A225UY81_9STRA|nr:hypothetical protein PHMEG_00030705 [Phytophthora megakarya]
MRERNLTDTERRAIVQDILLAFRDDKVPHGTNARLRLARKYKCHRHTVERVWTRYTENVASGVADGSPESRIKENSGRKAYDRTDLAGKIAAVSVVDRRRIARTAVLAGISRGLLHLLLKEGHLTRRTTRIKPKLTDTQKLARMQWILTFIDENTYAFEGMYAMTRSGSTQTLMSGRICFFLMRNRRETLPEQALYPQDYLLGSGSTSKFSACRYDFHRKAVFDGKIGIWPLVEQYTAQRSSVNRPAGTVLTRNFEAIDRNVIKRFLLGDLIPAIKSKWPARERPRLPHDPDIVAAGTAGGWNIRLIFQPANSPDLNVLDLGFFSSIQAVQLEHPVHDVKELVSTVLEAYDKLTWTTLDDVFLSLQNVMLSILRSRGDNEFVLHLGKQKLRRAGKLPEVLTCPEELFNSALAAVGGDPFVEPNNSDNE